MCCWLGQGQADAEATYRHLDGRLFSAVKESADYYRAYLDNTVSVELPDRQLQQSYDWARVSVLQGLVTNPYLGTGLIAGYRTSGGSQRPGSHGFSVATRFGLHWRSMPKAISAILTPRWNF